MRGALRAVAQLPGTALILAGIALVVVGRWMIR